MIPILNLGDGSFAGLPPQSLRTLGDLAGLFEMPLKSSNCDLSQVVYEIHGPEVVLNGEPRLLYATTILNPGNVGKEFFMTRGHFHSKPERGEFMLTLAGKGALVLMNRERKTWTEPMSEGSTHDIDGSHAHRVANTGEVPLVFIVVWMSDCGHEYEEIANHGFGGRCKQVDGLPKLVA